MRGVVYEPAGPAVPAAAGAEGAEIARRLTELNRIPFAALDSGPADVPGWLGDARRAVDGLLAAALG